MSGVAPLSGVATGRAATAPRPGALPKRPRPVTAGSSSGIGRPRIWWTLGIVGAFAVLLGAVSLQVMLIGGQRRLDAVRNDIQEARVAQNALRRDESRLRSPADIRDLATERLGMVPSELPALVPSASRTIGFPAGDPRGAGTPTTLPAAPVTAAATDPAAATPAPPATTGETP